jgi:hypothetical protein
VAGGLGEADTAARVYRRTLRARQAARLCVTLCRESPSPTLFRLHASLPQHFILDADPCTACMLKYINSRYVALVTGRVEGEGLIDFPLDGRAAVTLYRAAAASRVTPPAAGGGGDGEAAAGGGGGWVTRVHLWPKTGRTHQVRVKAARVRQLLRAPISCSYDRPYPAACRIQSLGYRVSSPRHGQASLQVPGPVAHPHLTSLPKCSV